MTNTTIKPRKQPRDLYLWIVLAWIIGWLVVTALVYYLGPAEPEVMW